VLPGQDDHWWFGYSIKLAIVAMFATPLLLSLFLHNNHKLNLALAVFTYIIAILIYLPSILRPPWGVIDRGHSIYVINEIVGPSTGNYPLVNFTAQYTSLLGYVFDFLFQHLGTIDQAIWFLTILATSTVVISIAPLVRAFPEQKGIFGDLVHGPGHFYRQAQ